MFSSVPMLDTGRGWRRLHPRAWACVALAGAWLTFFAPVIFTTRVPYERDILVTVLPLRHYLLERLRVGELPQWFPYELLGVPFTGSLVASPFHPQVLVFLLLGAVQGTKWSLLLAILVGLAGAYRLGRELSASRPASIAGALVFGLGGYGTSLSSNPPFLVPFMTAPWVLFAVHKLIRRQRLRDVAVLALAWALVFLGGDAQLFLVLGFVALGMLVAFGGGRRAWLLFSAGGAITAALISVELLPILSTDDESIRAYWKPTAELAGVWSLHPLRLLDFLVPRFVPRLHRFEFGQVFEGQGDLFVETLFVGGIAIALTGVALWNGVRGALLWSAVAALGVALALGHRGGLLEALWGVAPIFAKFRIPEKYVGLAVLAMVPLVAAGVDQLAAGSRRTGWALIGFGGALLFVSLLVPGRTLVGAMAGGPRSLSSDLSAALASGWTSGLLATGAFVVLVGVARLWAPAGILPLALPALMVAELTLGNAGRTPLASASVVADLGVLPRALEKEHVAGEPPPRILPARGGTSRKDIPDDELVRAIHEWFFPDESGRSHAVAFQENSSAGRARVNRLIGSFSSRERPLWHRRFNVCYRAADARQPPQPGESIVASVEEPPVSLVRRDCLPRAILANALGARDRDAARDRMRQGLADDDAVWEGGPTLNAAGGDVRWLEASPERLRMEVDARSPAALVVSDAFARGWSATVDGSPVPIHPTNVAVRGVEVPAGHHIVEMKYQTPGLMVGAALSFLGLVACGLLLPRRRPWSKVTA